MSKLEKVEGRLKELDEKVGGRGAFSRFEKPNGVTDDEIHEHNVLSRVLRILRHNTK